MSDFSCFAPFGMFEFSSEPSKAERIYDQIRASVGEVYTQGTGYYHDAKHVAWSLALGAAWAELERLGVQFDPGKALDLLPVLEREHDLPVGARATLPARRTALTSRMLLPAGAALHNVEAGLSALLGADFVGLELEASPVSDPSDPVTQNSGNWPDRWPERRVYRLTGPAVAYTTETVGYEAVAPVTKALEVGEHVIVTGENPDISERVLIQGATASTITFSHLRPHGTGDSIVVGGFPMWRSNRRHAIVNVSATAAVDAEKRRLVDDYMSRVTRVVSTWEISSSALGPFILDESPMDATPFGA
jgi:hypothetical protein